MVVKGDTRRLGYSSHVLLESAKLPPCSVESSRSFADIEICRGA